MTGGNGAEVASVAGGGKDGEDDEEKQWEEVNGWERGG